MNATIRRTARQVLTRFGALDAALVAEMNTSRFLPIGPHRDVLRFYSHFVRRGDLCFDVGANLGQKTWIFHDLGASVIAVEPQITCVRKLRAAFASSPLVTVVPKAVGAAQGVADLYLCDQSSTISTMSNEFRLHGRFSEEATWKNAQRVPVTTLDALIAEYGLPSFCKIDVEGFEEDVLAGLNQTIPTLSFEMNREFLPSAERSVARLRSLGYRSFNFVPNRRSRFLFEDWVQSEMLFAALKDVVDPLLVGEIYATADRPSTGRPANGLGGRE